MGDLNYHHLLYFWTVARTGSISKASIELHLTQPTISEQLRLLENSLGQELFDRIGRSLVLTDAGKTVFQYAEKIFALGQELKSAISSETKAVPPTLRILVDPTVNSDFVAWLLRPLAKRNDRPQLNVDRGPIAQAFPHLLAGEIDLLLGIEANTAKSYPGAIRHLLCECGTVFLASHPQRSAKFPKSLDGLALFSSAEPTRSQLQQWFRDKRIEPTSAGSVSDPDLAFRMAELGLGTIAMPDLPGRKTPANLKSLGKADELKTRLYAFTRERRPRNPTLALLLASAQKPTKQ